MVSGKFLANVAKFYLFLRPAVFGLFHSILLNYVGLNNGEDLDILKHKQELSSVCYQQLSMVLVDKVYFAKKTRLEIGRKKLSHVSREKAQTPFFSVPIVHTSWG